LLSFFTLHHSETLEKSENIFNYDCLQGSLPFLLPSSKLTFIVCITTVERCFIQPGSKKENFSVAHDSEKNEMGKDQEEDEEKPRHLVIFL
jgi:hypothetical protein